MDRREFHFVEGASSKFWVIELDETRFKVTWGRIGTAGQSQTKEFGSAAEAKKQHDKLVAEKVKKGYQEIGASASTAKTTPASHGAGKAKVAAATAVVVPPAPTPSIAAPTALVSAPVAVVNLEVDRSIGLEPGDWLIATWRPRQPIPRPQPLPFDLNDCVSRVARVAVGLYGWQWSWETARIPVAMTPEEAHFWLLAMSKAGKQVTPKELAARLAGEKYRKISRSDASRMLKSKLTSVTSEVLLPLSNLLSLEELVEMMSEPVDNKATSFADTSWNCDPEIMFGFQRYLLPYLTDSDVERIRKAVASKISINDWPTDHYHRPPAPFFLAAMMGLSDRLLPIVQSWKEGFYQESGWDHTHYHQPQIIVLGLGSPKLVESEMRRNRLPLNKPQFIRGWLATTEYAALDYVRDCILAITNREEAEGLLRTFALVKAPEAAGHMLELKLSSKAPKIAREWLDANVGCAIAGLIPLTAGRGKLADAAIEHLRDLKRAGHGDLIRKAAGAGAPERLRNEVLEHVEKIYRPLDASSTPTWLTSAMVDAPRAAKLPSWLAPHALPLLTIGENRLSDEQVMAVLAVIQKSGFDSPHPLLKSLRENASPESRDAFAWRLFESWLAEGAPSREKWAMGAIGHLGADGCVLRLTPMIRNWPGESQHQRAVFGLECLRSIGSDTALMSLNGIAQKLKFKGLKSKAMEFMEAIAGQRGMSRSQLEDRIVPDCDLDEKGTRIFDFGPRQFRLVLGADMKPMIKDADGKVKSDLPAPNSKDDPARAREAGDTWKLLKKQVKEVAKIQAERLEQAMITGRRWTPAEFNTLLVKHPLMINLVRLLLWGGYDASGKLVSSFRATEDQTLAGADDGELKLPSSVAQVGIVHPLHLPDDKKKAWGEIFSDYEIVPPFEQLGRPIHALEKAEEKATEITRFGDVKIPATALVGTLERLAWVRGIPEDGGVFHEHSKPFYGADVTCIVQYEDGVPVGYMEGWEDQRISGAFFISGVYKPTMYVDHKQKLKLGDVDPVVVSEVLKDLTLIASKGK